MFTQQTFRALLVAFLLALGIAACGQPADLPETEAPTDVEATDTPATESDDVAADETTTDETAADDSTSDKQTDSSSGAAGATFTVPAPGAGDPTMTTLVALNVRSGPGTDHNIVGTLPAGAQARIIGTSADGGWWKIRCSPEVESQCWSSAGTEYSSAANIEALDSTAAAPATSTPTDSSSDGSGSNDDTPPSPTQSPNANASPTATVAQGETQPTPTATQVANTTMTATATQAAGASPTATPTQAPPTATATATPTVEPTATTGVPIAQFDNDSLQNPARSVFLSITGNRDFSYSNAVSYPNGDQEDWVEFEFPNDSNTNQPVWITLECSLTGSETAQLRATLWSDETRTTQIAICNEGETQLTVNNTEVQQLQIHFGIPDDAGVYAEYTVTVTGYK